MKIRSKVREQRPLLQMQQEAPILSDEIPSSFEDEQQQQQTMMKVQHQRNDFGSSSSSNHHGDVIGGGGSDNASSSNSIKVKKRPLLKRLFGKTGDNGKATGAGAGRQQKEQTKEFEHDDDFDNFVATLSFTNSINIPDESATAFSGAITPTTTHSPSFLGRHQDLQQEEEREVPSSSKSLTVKENWSSSKLGGGRSSSRSSRNGGNTTEDVHGRSGNVGSTAIPTTSSTNNIHLNTVSSSNNKVSSKNRRSMRPNDINNTTGPSPQKQSLSSHPGLPLSPQSRSSAATRQHHQGQQNIHTTNSRSSSVSQSATTTRIEDDNSMSLYRNGESLITNTSSRTNHTVATTVISQPQGIKSKRINDDDDFNDEKKISDHTDANFQPNTTDIGDRKKVLSRPFGREHILSMNHTWLVHVARAEWEPEDSQWKYRVTIQRREGNKLHEFASGFTLRSIQDFAWLEQSLTNEFLGGLLLPSLSIYLGVADIQNCQHEIDSRLLTNWLSDTLNGVRGQGELQFKLTKVDVATSESMDAFLFRTDLDPMDLPKTPVSVDIPNSLRSPRQLGNNPSRHGITLNDGNDDWNSFFPELCYTDCVRPDRGPVNEVLKTPVNIIQGCSSPALGNARTFNVQQDSFVEATMTFDDNNASLAIHADLLKGERDLILSWRMQCLQGMEKLRILQEQEKHIGAAWKRFAISVSNLFSYEKDMETARLGDSKSRRDLQMPYRKLQKSAVDDCLRILARQKVERSIPSIDAVNLMLSAYVADLSMVQPATQAYLGGLHLLAGEQAKTEAMEAAAISSGMNPGSRIRRQSSSTLADKIQASINEVKKQLVLKSSGDDSIGLTGGNQSGKAAEERHYRQRQQVQTIENRVLMNESLLKDFMTTVCKTATVRTARMMYTYLDRELAQCTALSDAAIDMKSKINVASKDSLSKMVHRHNSEIKEDISAEMKLVNRIVNIGSNTRKFTQDDDDDNVGEEVEKGVELSADLVEEENRKTQLRDAAMEQCRERIGRWDAKVAMKIMEAVGVSDANVRVEETTRDLRMVRKYAIGLRENVERCTEALDILRMSILQSGVGDVRDIRDDFMAEFRNLLSLTFVPPSDSQTPFPTHLLQKEGINLSDPGGWKSNEKGTCGGGLVLYLETRDSGTEWLLQSLGDLLKLYHERVEMIESFVYMECVGIQLEKHFSHARATALTAFEKKTDITSAINIATRKKMPVLVKELQAKLEAVGADVSHTSVKDAKEAHLESKKLKEELHALAMRRLNRAREASTERVIALMTVWAKEEAAASKTEKALMEALKVLVERSLSKEDLETYIEYSPSRNSM